MEFKNHLCVGWAYPPQGTLSCSRLRLLGLEYRAGTTLQLSSVRLSLPKGERSFPYSKGALPI
eukprot:scaffold82632_cov34-Attheya_sp.AAC.1